MNKQVADLLFDEPAELTKLYGYLVTHMDYSTCVVGVKRRLSYQAMKELLEVSATKGRKRVPSSKEKARAFIKRMCVIGLIVDQGHCVYKLSYESPNNSDLRRFPQGSREVAEHLACDNSNLASKFPQDSRELPTHLYKKKKTTVDAFVMTDDWEPSEGFADMVLSGLGLDVTVGGKHEWLLSRGLMENRMYYQSGEWVTHSETQHGWHRRLIHQMKVIYKAKKDESTTKSSNVVPIAKAANAYRKKQDGSLIPRVPNFVDQKAMLDWWKQHAKLGAPSVSAKRYNDYKEWRYDLDQWRTNHLLELKKKEQG